MATEVSSRKKASAAAPPLRVPDAASMLAGAWNRALEYCAGKMGCSGSQIAMEQVRQGDSIAASYCSYSLAKDVARCLGEMDTDVKGVYLFECEATPEDLCFGEVKGTSLIHLLVWAGRKTAALNSLLAALDATLREGYAALFSTAVPAHLLDAQIADDDEVSKRIGYGALLSSLQYQPIQLWRR